MFNSAKKPVTDRPLAGNSGDEPLELRISSKLMSITRKMNVLDAAGEVVYRVRSKAVSLNDRTFIEDAQGAEVADIHAKVISIHDVYYVDMADGVSFELSRELLHLNDVINIDALGWQLRSRNFLDFDFDVTDPTGALVASAKRKIFSLHSEYLVTVYDRAQADEVVALFVIMKHIVEQRAASAASDSTSD